MALRKHHFDDDHTDKTQIEKTPTGNGGKLLHFTLDIKPELAERIEAAASENNLSVGDYVESVLEKAVPEKNTQDALERERKPVHPDALEKLEKLQNQIMERRGGKLFEDSTEMIRQMREERIQYLMEVQEDRGTNE